MTARHAACVVAGSCVAGWVGALGLLYVGLCRGWLGERFTDAWGFDV